MVHVGHVVLKDKNPKYPEYMWCSCCRDVTRTRMVDEGFDDPFGGASCWEEVCSECGEYRCDADKAVRVLQIQHKVTKHFWSAWGHVWVRSPVDATKYDAHDYTSAWVNFPEEGDWVIMDGDD